MTVAGYDVIVVGGGNAALCAALSAREHCERVLVLERAPQDEAGGNSRFTAGAMRVAYRGVDDLRRLMPDLSADEIARTDFGTYTEEQFFDDLGRVTQYRCDPDLTEVLVKRSFETLLWMRSKGVRFVPIYGRQAFKVDGRFKFWGGLTVETWGGGPGLVDALTKGARSAGIDVSYSARVLELLHDDDGVHGVRVRREGTTIEVRGRSVVLAGGGFQANPEWRARYLGPGWELAKVRGTRFNTGDVIRMALDIGAAPAGNWSGCHAVGWERNAPEFGDLAVGDAFQKHSYPFGIMLNADGHRFVDEGADFRNYTYAKYGRVILAQPEQFAWQLFDAKVLHLLRDEYRIKQVTKVSAASLEELAGKLEDVNAAAALEEIRRYNAAVRQDVPFDPNVKDGRCTTGLVVNKSNWANTIDEPPFEAYAVTCGITFTFGGLRINTDAQVMSTDGEPIAGLYAAGEMVGGIFYFNYPGGSGLTNGAVFGRIAGAAAALGARARRDGVMGQARPKPFLIGGQWIGDSAETIVSVNPANGQVNYEVCAATPRQVDAAVATAREAACAPAWRDLLPHNRARLLHKLADVIEARREDFARTQMQENGKVLAECRAQAGAAAATFRYYASVCETSGSEVTPPRGAYLSMTVYEPYGVVAAITPWNSPLTMEAQKVAPALAAGNAVILKPSEVTPGAALGLGQAALDAGIPSGVLNVLTGTGAVAGDALVRHPGVKFVSFTGGTASGRRIAAIAAEKLMPVALELGGKSPHIVFADADLDAAAAAVADGIFEASGQSCVAGSRLFVQRAAYERVLALVAERARQFTLDLPDAPGAKLGPLSSFAHRERVERFVESGRKEGGEIVTGGARPAQARLSGGAYYLPTVIAGLTNAADVCQQEIFGPVLCALPFEDEEDLVRQANDSAYGLAAGIWTADYRRAWRVARRLDAGTIWINTYKQLSIATPFGGFKDSGIGREKGIGGLRLYQQAKGLYFGLDGPRAG